MDPSALPPTREFPVEFGGVVPPEEQAPIHAAGSSQRGPKRSSRHLSFEDDGKLFEGHLTVQSRQLKSIIQYLVDSQAEQSLVVQDLQDQVHNLKTKLLKANRGKGLLPLRAAKGMTGEQDDVTQRLKALEDFVLLWGVRPEDVAKLVETFGNPVIPPEEYHTYLLDLPAFRLLRQETHQLVASGGERPTITPEKVAADNDTASRRAGRAGTADSDPQDRTAMEVAGEALRLVEELSAQMEKNSTGPSKSAQFVNMNPTDPNESRSTDRGVDEIARQSIEELAEYVEQRFQTMERNAGNANNTGSVNMPRPPPQNANLNHGNREVVDVVAREDAAASLDMIEELERLMERRFKEMATSIANVALRRNTPSDDTAPVVAETQAAVPVETITPKRAVSPATDNVHDDILLIADRVEDIENDFNRRWQNLEERLRIIGRATMNRPAVSPTNAPAIDRKAREDSSLSLMRVQKVEKDLIALRRQLAVGAPSKGMEGGPSTELSTAPPPLLAEDGLKDVYDSKVKSLEEDVERRMAEVNRTIALLKGGEGGGGINISNLLANSALYPPQVAAERGMGGVAPRTLTGGETSAPSQGATTASTEGDGGAAPVKDTTGGGPSKPSYIVLRSTEAEEDTHSDGRIEIHSTRVVPSSWPARPLPQSGKENTARGGRPLHSAPHPTPDTHEGEENSMSAPFEGRAAAGGVVPSTQAAAPDSSEDTHRRESLKRLQQYDVKSSLTHKKPCTIPNCEWCAAEEMEAQS